MTKAFGFVLVISLFGAWSLLRVVAAGPDDEVRPITLEALEKLPVGLEVVHNPNPARATETGKSDVRKKYTWRYATTVTAKNSDVRIVEFGAFIWTGEEWFLGNYTGKPFGAKEFADWYGCADAVIKKGGSCSDAKNWGSAELLRSMKSRWYFVGINEAGERVRGDAVVEELAEMDPKNPKEENE